MSFWGLSPWLADVHLLAVSSQGLLSVPTFLASLCVFKFSLLIKTPVRLN